MKGTTTAMDETEREQRDDALAALLFRGVQPQKAQQLIELEEATPDRIIAACHRWDGDHIGAGALVYRIQHGDFRGPEPDARELRQQRLRETFDAVIARFPIGTAIGLHAKYGASLDPEERSTCAGKFVVTEANYPVMVSICDECGLDLCYGPRNMQLLPERPYEERIPF